MAKWTYYLPSDVYSRLCNCTSTKSDTLILAQARWATMKENPKYCKEDALVAVLELLDYNFDLTCDEYDDILANIL